MGGAAMRNNENIVLVNTPATPGDYQWRQEAPLSGRIDVLKDVTLTLLQEVRALNGAPVIDVGNGIDFYEEVSRFEVEMIRRALEHTAGHQVRAARLLGLKVTTLNSMIKRYQIALLPPDENPPSRSDE
ncbi:MAG TPA: helix-turn-helix domain-containing protein [Pyrinomonadaceae bacterium]|nr:helix-turn-helix domain-containing protein [Pyrinomonadaceae bacterium]